VEVFISSEKHYQMIVAPCMMIVRKMSMLFQSGAFLSNISVFDNVRFPLRDTQSLSEGIIRTIVFVEVRKAVGLRGCRLALMPNELSGGMAPRRASISKSNCVGS